MQAFQLTFFTQQNRTHHGLPVADWLLKTARHLGLPGGTVFAGTEGYGHDRRLHTAHFFDLSDQPVEITFELSAEETERLFAFLSLEPIALVYTKQQVEYGTVGGAAPPPTP
ncbi:MAG: DUF190 domain-containing protein [Rhodoferax sp.]